MSIKQILYCILSLTVSAFILCSCSESEPLASGESRLPDIDASELVGDDGVIHWPAELLPEGFPEAEFLQIYSANRKDNEIIITMFAERDMTKNPVSDFGVSLIKNGFVTYFDPGFGTNMTQFVNRDGYRVVIYDSRQEGSHLTAINEESPTGYTYEIHIRKIDVAEDMQSLFWKYPEYDADLGLESITFEQWPSDNLPENFPVPGEEIEITVMRQTSAGVNITLKGKLGDVGTYIDEIYNAGYKQTALQPFPDKDGNHCFIEYTGREEIPGENDVLLTVKLLIRKVDEHVDKGE